MTITQIIAYRLLLAAYGPKLTWRQAATLSWVPGLAKYVPGKVVAIGSTVYLLRKYQISAAIALSVALMGDAVAVLTGLIAGIRCSSRRKFASICPAAGSGVPCSFSRDWFVFIRPFLQSSSTSHCVNSNVPS